MSLTPLEVKSFTRLAYRAIEISIGSSQMTNFEEDLSEDLLVTNLNVAMTQCKTVEAFSKLEAKSRRLSELSKFALRHRIRMLEAHSDKLNAEKD